MKKILLLLLVGLGGCFPSGIIPTVKHGQQVEHIDNARAIVYREEGVLKAFVVENEKVKLYYNGDSLLLFYPPAYVKYKKRIRKSIFKPRVR